MLQLFLDSTPSVPLLRKPFLIKPRYEIDIAKTKREPKTPEDISFQSGTRKTLPGTESTKGNQKTYSGSTQTDSRDKKTNSWAPETPTETEKHHGDKKNQSGKNDPTGRKNTIPGTKNTEPYNYPPINFPFIYFFPIKTSVWRIWRGFSSHCYV